MTDAVVIGAGPNGLVAANLLADEGWEVLVLEGGEEPGGAVRTGEITVPGFRHDLFSAFYPLAAASPHMRRLDLERHGVRWRRSPIVVAHPTADGRCAYIAPDVEETAASLDGYAPGDGEAWKRLYGLWERTGRAMIDALFTPFPPARPALRLAAGLGPSESLRFLRFMTLPVRRLAEERFEGHGGANLLAGNALHADLTPDSAAGGLFGWMLCCLGQQLGFPVPAGGAGELTAALVRRLRERGGEVRCGTTVTRVVIRGRRAVGVRTAGGDEIGARRAVLADVDAPRLYRQLVGPEHVPERLREDIRRFQWDSATVKIDWALREPIPWTCPPVRRAGTVHIAEGMDALTRTTSQLQRRLIPDRPFVVLGQYAAADDSRAPAGAETAWAYTHVPQKVAGDAAGELRGTWDEQETERFVERMEDEIERHAPGFRALVLGRHVHTPVTLERANPNLHGGALNAGTAQIHQQFLFRPVPGLGRSETPVTRLFLASASAHPGGGVHGGPGANAARAALLHDRGRRVAVALGAGAVAGAASGRLSRR